MEHRVTLTYPGRLGEDRADQLLNTLLAQAPHMAPVITEHADSHSIVLAVDAADLNRALLEASDMLGSVLPETGPTNAEVELVTDHAPATAA